MTLRPSQHPSQKPSHRLSQMPTRYLDDQSLQPVAGMDEAGCGPWAGPLVAAAVILPLHKKSLATYCMELRDSKLLSPARRAMLFKELTQDPDVHCGVGIASVQEIDDHLLRGALPIVYKRAIDNLGVRPATVLMDGIRDPKLNIPTTLLKHGDKISISIAAASIIAKVVRDQLMDELHISFPWYGWDRNKGYGTSLHKDGLTMMGVSPHHRRSYKPIQRSL